ncbi:predicted protein [Nematostella vectensis]|uniref:GDP-Man:Man(3)GlcNAc(2)-PP-Dol alpha-1,2-mannosyltransferase n=1 Tax=Nematostella vectensis TaxID=45351 RepID=A7SNN8_NEMVE|nr:predicted protein [Nematostella vectensis]|eukprot:XP_001626808.1 predicted protein [Nematostella vectensis]
MQSNLKPVVIGFFHPYCNAGGGGERVLWIGIRAIQQRYNFVKCVVYTGDSNVSGPEILEKAKTRFNISLPGPVEFVFLKNRSWVEAARYPVFTLLGQSLGSVLLGWEALTSYVPDIYIDTMGYAFTMPLFKYIGGCQVGCYVHYPTISTDMLARVGSKESLYNNSSLISNSRLLSLIKLLYYYMFAFIYGMAGRCADVIMVNSSWTYGHIMYLWKNYKNTSIVYPPCDTKSFQEIPICLPQDGVIKTIISIGQFRPEKDHPLQLKAFAEFLKGQPKSSRSQYKLVLIGSCRNQDDADRVDNLRELAKSLSIRKHVDFALNVSFDELREFIGSASIGLHTMWNEHFGIGVVECMAGGIVMLAHESGGPKMDIVIEWEGKPTGFLASDEKSYASAMETIFSLQPEERSVICHNARSSVARFSESAFELGFLRCTETLFMGV